MERRRIRPRRPLDATGQLISSTSSLRMRPARSSSALPALERKEDDVRRWRFERGQRAEKRPHETRQADHLLEEVGLRLERSTREQPPAGREQSLRIGERRERAGRVLEHIRQVNQVVALVDRQERAAVNAHLAERHAGAGRALGRGRKPLGAQPGRARRAHQLARAAADIEEAALAIVGAAMRAHATSTAQSSWASPPRRAAPTHSCSRGSSAHRASRARRARARKSTPSPGSIAWPRRQPHASCCDFWGRDHDY